MQKIATRVFICASIVFGIAGILLVITLPGPHGDNSTLNMFFMRLVIASGFIVLTSFALSVAGKYLDGKF